ncbi:MAG TPA: DNA methyltransferase, partial [Thermoanaerobaculia bacterium]
MISAATVDRQRGIGALVALLGGAGFEVRLRPIEPARWEATGVAPDLAHRVVVSHAARHGRVEVLAGEGVAPVADVNEFLNSISRWNVITKFIILYSNTESGLLSLFGLDSKGRARRIDFDPARPRRDALERLGALELRDRRPGELERALERALERETVGRRFFLRFRDDARALEAELFRAHPDEGAAERASEALLVLSRILFLYFVQQKGWLDGNRSFLADLVERSRRVREGLFTGVFLPLFFGCLNTPEGRRDPLARRFGRIPYLNGGLFERSAFERRHPVIGIDDALLERIVFETFERFQFVIEENDETGAHIDPEMLGRVFESLMAEDERLSSGSFYTPRSVVDVLVRNALTARLAGDLDGRGKAVARVLSGGSHGAEVPDRDALRRELASIRLIDPACGSGAFLLSALQNIERLATALGGEGKREVFARRRIVERLYGIDLKPEAVRLCELRLWLAVAAAEPRDPARVEPLPNLDR